MLSSRDGNRWGNDVMAGSGVGLEGGKRGTERLGWIER